VIVNKNPEHSELKLKVPFLPVGILISVIVIGTLGFHYIWGDENATWIDALYMVMITVTTIGYGEVHKLSHTGQIFTMVIAVFGIASLFYIFTTVMESLVFKQIYNIRGKKRMLKKVSKMYDHYIVVGYGRVGKIVYKDLLARGKQCVVIDNDFDESTEKEHTNTEFKGIMGDASDDEVLLLSSIKNAKAVIVTIGNPAVSTFVVLTARELNKDIYIIARGDHPNLDSKLYKAGADKVINPYETGGKKLANFAVNPNISDFMETNFNAGDQKLRLERFKLPHESNYIGKTLTELDIRKNIGVTVIAIIRNDKAELNPRADYTVNQKDEFVALGTPEQIAELYKSIETSKV
jgi:voltage-gated potassium channel